MKWLRALWADDRLGNDGSTIEPSERRFRSWVLLIGMIFGPPLIFLFYYKTMFPGLTNSDALDFAQLGRNLAAGKGFTTYLLRPLAIGRTINPYGLPDTLHGPLYPFLLALAYGILGAKDSVTAWVSGLFYMLTVPVLYYFALRVFDRAVALFTVLIFTANSLMLEYAVSGLHITLYTFLATCLFFLIYTIAEPLKVDPATGGVPALAPGKCVTVGILAALLYLTDPIFAWVAPIIGGVVFTISRNRQWRALGMFLLPVLILTGPWMIRNLMLSGNPVFGLRGMELWMDTRSHYPGLTIFRMFPSEITPGVDIFQSVVQKVLLGIGQVIQNFPQITASWVLAFFLPCLLFSFTGHATNVLRRTVIHCLLALMAGSLIFRTQLPIFVAIIPAMLLFSVAYLLHLIAQARLNVSAVATTTLLLGIAVVFPLLSDMFLTDKLQPLRATAPMKLLARNKMPGDVGLSDQPAAVAWYSSLPTVLVPQNETDVAALRTRFPHLRWLVITDQAQRYSPQWQYIYQAFLQWNMSVLRARQAGKPAPGPIQISGKAFPLAEGLGGFTSVEPSVNEVPGALIAGLPVPRPQREGAGTPPNRGAAR